MTIGTDHRYELVSTRPRLEQVVRRCRELGQTALDFETTSLSPADGEVRLVSLCNEEIHAVVDFWAIKGRFAGCASLFDFGSWVVFNAGFERRWFQAAGVKRLDILDVGHLRRSVVGGGVFRLLDMARWDLNLTMDKEQQLSDWSSPDLTQEQLDYAYLDADVTWRLWRKWSKALTTDLGWQGFKVFNDMVPAVMEMEDTGIFLDRKAHTVLLASWEAEKVARVTRIRELVEDSDVRNINSGRQWSEYFSRIIPDHFLAGWPRTEKSGDLSVTGVALRGLAGRVPGTPLETLFDALAEYKTVTKYISSFGQPLLDRASKDGRLRARYNIGAAITGRFSSSGPNLQQVPRDKDILGVFTSVRKSFVAPLGRLLVSLDYSGIELRVLALLSGDKQLLKDMVEGDVHSEVAAVMSGSPIDRSTPEGKSLRQSAKAVSFGIVYGAAASGLSATMRTDEERAQGYIDFWSARYPDAFRYRYTMLDEAVRTGKIRCVDGGSIEVGYKPALPKLANYPVQRAAFSVMSGALVAHKASLDTERAAGRQRMTRMISTIHDAIIDEASTQDAASCLELMRGAMVAGYLKYFPGAPTERLVEGGIGKSWGELA